MTHVADGSSSHGSSETQGKSTVFDVSTDSGMLGILRVIHRSNIKQRTKNDLRDLLFDAKAGDRDKRKQAEAALLEAGFSITFGEPSVATKTEDATTIKSTPSIGRTRVAPQYIPVSQPVIAKSQSTDTAAPIVQEKKIQQPPVSQQPVFKPKPKPEPELPESVEKTTSTPKPSMSENAPSTQPTSQPVAPEQPLAQTGSDQMERIKEIKRLINEKVGNPITLIDTDNQVGREYMNALLAAMKVVNGGTPAEVSETMQRLEAAYEAAVQVIENNPTPPTATEKFVAASEPTPVSSAVQDTQDAAHPETDAAPAPVSGYAQMSQQSAPKPEPVEDTVSDQSSLRVKGEPAPIEPPLVKQTGSVPIEPVVSQSEAESSIPVVNKMKSMEADAVALASAPSSPSITSNAVTSSGPSTSTDSTTQASSRLMSVAKEEQLQKLMRQNQQQELETEKAAEAQERNSTDPLQLTEVTAGLKQLLSEWSLFKSSGFFGTGPGGNEHPLYKKLAGLTMAAVIAGRFEGATPQVKQSITDYMNGWRYEEGIVHEHTETFEHYLRRVIRHILENKGKELQ